jgi:hypothetical protein
VPTRVLVNEAPITCYAWLEGNSVWCEARPLCKALDARILEGGTGGLTVRHGSKVKTLAPSAGREWYIAGEFLRAPVRDIAKGLGLKCTPMKADDGVSWKVYIAL